MATKPSTDFAFAATTLYTSGDRIGDPTKVAPVGTEGEIPGEEAAPETLNYCLNITGEYTTWVLAGSSSADEDAHIMETTAAGLNSTASMVLGGTAATTAPLAMTENSGYATACLVATNSSTGYGIIGAATNTNAGVYGTNTGAGPGVRGVNVGGDDNGVEGVGNTTGAGVHGTGGATGAGVVGVGGSTSGNGVTGTCTAGTGAGVSGTGSSTATSSGVLGTAGANDGMGVAGYAQVAGANPLVSTAAAVAGFADEGSAVWGSSASGHGVVAQGDSTSPIKSSLRIAPQNANPSSPGIGDVYVNNTSNLETVRAYLQSSWTLLHHSAKGFVGAVSAIDSGSNNDNATPTVSAGVSIASPNLPSQTGTVALSATLSLRNSGSTLNSVVVDIYDVTEDDVVESTEVVLALTAAEVAAIGSGNGYEKTVTLSAGYSLPDTSAREFRLRVAKGSVGSTGVEWVDARLTMRGIF